MAIFMEVRCEGLSDIDGCFSSQNAGSITSARESVKSVSIALKFLKDDSLNNGWVLHKGELYCPVCAKAKALAAAGIKVKGSEHENG
ncbi:TPA: hypothetical protein ACJG4C_004507 [Salmonella enterica subsp. diarizonae serovar 61:r:z53]